MKANCAQLLLFLLCSDGLCCFFMQFISAVTTQFKDLHKKGVAGAYIYITACVLYVAYSFYFNVIFALWKIYVIIIMQIAHCLFTSLITALVFFYSLDFLGKKKPFV